MVDFYIDSCGRWSNDPKFGAARASFESLLSGQVQKFSEGGGFGDFLVSLQINESGNLIQIGGGSGSDSPTCFKGPRHYFLTEGGKGADASAFPWPAAYQLMDVGEEFLNFVGRLEDLFPGIGKLGGCTQHPSQHAEGDALVHTAIVFAEARKLLTDDWSERQELLLLAAAVCHDIEKPATRLEEGDKITFNGHAKLAAERCGEFAERLGFNQIEAEALEWLVRHHMDAHMMETWGENKRLAIYQHPFFKVLVALQEADARASWRNADGSEHAPVLREFLERDSMELIRKAERAKNLADCRKAIGEGLKKAGVEPGPLYGEAIKEALAFIGDPKSESVREGIVFALGYLARAKKTDS